MASHLQPTENDPPSKSPPEPSQEELKIVFTLPSPFYLLRFHRLTTQKTLESKIAKLNDEISIVKSRISEAYAQLTCESLLSNSIHPDADNFFFFFFRKRIVARSCG